MDKELLNRIYTTYQKDLYLYIYSLCGSREVAEDLLQETFMKALFSLDSQHTNVRAWLYMVARNLYFNYYKKEKGKMNLEDTKISLFEDSDLNERVIAEERKHILYEALRNLSQVKREVVVLQYFGGLSQKEIAAVLRISPENVRVQGYRAKKELKIYMEAKGYDI